MSEKTTSHEQDPSLRRLIQASQHYLKERPVRLGQKYEPITIPLTWLFTKTPHGVVVGYRVSKDYRPTERREQSPDDQFRWDVFEKGLSRSMHKRIRMSDDTLRYVDLEEYQEARLEGRQVVPCDMPPLYRLKLSERDGEGPTDEIAESVIYSADQGLINHYVSPYYASERPEAEPLEQAMYYLDAPDVE